MIFLSLFECLVLTLLASGESMGELCCVPSTHIQRNVQYNLNVKDVLTSSSNFHRSLWPQPNKIILHNTNHSTINVLYLSPHLCLEIYVGDQLKTQQNAILRSAFITKICPNIPTTSPPTSQLSLPDNVHINSVRKLVVRLKLEGEPITPTANSIESYELDIRAPVATIQATEVWGARHAFETFFQLVGRDNHGFSFPWFRPVKIIDEPKYSWRGLMLDTSRHYFSITSIQRTLQAMSMNKLNVFHWHISDAPSYPLILNNTPELGLLGSHRSDMVYTENDIRSIVSFSHIHGIRVVPEIDIPSHVASWGKSYPNVVIDCSSYASIDSDEYKRKDKDVLDPTNEKTYQLIGWVLDDLVNNFPDDYIHLGGDEVDLRCFNNEVMSRARVMFGDVNRLQLLQTFWNRVIKMVLDRKKIPIVWQGTYDSRIVLHKSVAVQSWKCWGRPLLGVQSFLNSRMDGHDVIQSSCYYLDWDSKFIDYYQQNRFHDHHRSGSSSSSSSNGQIFGGEICAW
jgi:hexosaminidase